MIATLIALAFVAGLIFRKLGYPPLLGYLLAGFVSSALNVGSAELLAPLANLGVTLLLFTIGLKLRASDLLRPYVFAPALLHMIVVVPLTTAVILLAGNVYQPLAFESQSAAWMLAFALSFSSTVFAIKMFDERGESASFYASIAIGVLVIQDLMAVGFLVVMADEPPSLVAALLLFVPLTAKLWKPLLSRLMVTLGHGELQLLFGFVFALGAYEIFELLHLKGGLGALLAGVMLGASNKTSARELYNRLVALKNLFLIGFFLQIGFYGLPSLPMLLIAALLTVLLFLRPLIYFSFFTQFGLRARTAWLSASGLFTYSEFGLIVAAIAVQSGYIHAEWLVTLALATALSFVVATPANKLAHQLYRKYAKKLAVFEKSPRLAAEVIEPLGDASIVVLGLGRVGSDVYQYLNALHPGQVIGVEENYERTADSRLKGFNCVHGDASDRDFWDETGLASRKLILVSLSNHRENLAVVALAKELGFNKTLAVTARFSDEKEELEALGCVSFNVYSDVGRAFAEHVVQQAKLTPPAR